MLLRRKIQQELICPFEMAAVILSGNWAIFSKCLLALMLVYSRALVLVLCQELTLAISTILLPFHCCCIVCFID